jgi:hypothetical protein
MVQPHPPMVGDAADRQPWTDRSYSSYRRQLLGHVIATVFLASLFAIVALLFGNASHASGATRGAGTPSGHPAMENVDVGQPASQEPVDSAA